MTSKVHINDSSQDLFIHNVIELIIGSSNPSNGDFIAEWCAPMASLVGPGPLYHPYTATAAGTKKGVPCLWAGDPDAGVCGEPPEAHGAPRLEAKVIGYQMVQSVVPAYGALNVVDGLRPATPLPRQHARAIGEALLAWADKNQPVTPTDIEVTREALLVERARLDKLIDVVTTIALAQTESPAQMLEFKEDSHG